MNNNIWRNNFELLENYVRDISENDFKDFDNDQEAREYLLNSKEWIDFIFQAMINDINKKVG